MNNPELYSLFLTHQVVTTDSRRVSPGSIFFALKGDHFNGNEFAAQALANGAAVAVIDDPAFTTGQRCVVVPDALKALQELATYHRSRFSIPLIAITGSNGKTTTKELMAAVLARSYNICATEGNLNNHIGVPLTLLRITAETEIAIIEMGANHPGEIAFLCSLARPTHGIITNIGRAHLEGFGSFEGVVQTKTELYRYLREHKGTIFINVADPLLVKHAARLTKIPYYPVPDLSRGDLPSFLPHQHHHNDNLTSSPPTDLTDPLRLPEWLPPDTTAGAARKNDTSTLDIRLPGGTREAITSNLFGSYNTANLLAAACTGAHFRVPIHDITEALSSYQPANFRSQIIQGKRNMLIMDAYNANPSSMREAIIDFGMAPYTLKYVILGDMLELGKESAAAHQEIVDLLGRWMFYSATLIGKAFQKTRHPLLTTTFSNVDMAMKQFPLKSLEGYHILIKGSRAMHLEKYIPLL